MISKLGIAGMAVKAIAFTALEKSDTLNSLVNAITWGKVNRDSLAKSIYANTIDFTAQYLTDSIKQSQEGDSLFQFRDKAHLVQHARQAVINNDMATMRESVNVLANHLVGEYTGFNSDGLASKAVRGAGGFVAEHLAASLVGENAAEKVLSTMAKEYGWDAAKSIISAQMGDSFFGQKASNLVSNILKRAIVDDPKFDAQGNKEIKLAADIAYRALTGEGSYEKPLRDYAPTLMAVNDAYNKPGSSFRQGLDYLHQNLGLQFSLQDCGMIFNYNNELNPMDPISINLDTTPREVAEGIIAWISVLGTEREEALDEQLRPMLESLPPKQREKLQEAASALSRAQLAPFAERSDMKIRMSEFTGKLSSVESLSSRIAGMNQAQMNEIEARLGMSGNDHVMYGGHKIAGALRNNIDTIDLSLAGTGPGYLKSLSNVGTSLFSAYWNSTDSGHQAMLDQLYERCGQDTDVMYEVSRFLDPRLARNALAESMFANFASPEDPETLVLGNRRISLAPAQEPKISFIVSNDHEDFTRVSIDVSYQIDSYGIKGAMYKPIGEQESSVISSATIIIRRDQQGGAPSSKIYPMGLTANIHNVVSFDSGSGDMRKAA